MSAQNLETLAKRYVELKSRIADLQEEADGLKAELMENREPGEYAAGPLTVKSRKANATSTPAHSKNTSPSNSTRTATRSNPKHCPRSSNRSAKTLCRIV